MPKLPKLVLFLLKFFVLYFALVLLVNATGLREGFRESFAGWANNNYKDFIPQAEASFQPNDELGEHDLNIIFVNTKTRDEKMAAARKAGLQRVNLDISASPFSVWDYFFLPFIVLIALVLAWPQSWRQRLISFATGGLVLYLFTWFRFRCTLWYLANASEPLEPLDLSDLNESILNGLYKMQSIEFIFISTFIIWALATIRKDDLSRLLDRSIPHKAG